MSEFMEKDRWFDSGFENADKYNDIAGLITSLDIQQKNSTLMDIKREMYEVVNLREDEQVLEVGCGVGGTLREMTKFIGKNGRIVGIDKSKLLLQEAVNRSVPSENIEYLEADVTDLPFDSESFSFAHAERVFMHLSSPLRGLSQMVRVLKKRGRIAITEPDLTSVEIYPNTKGISNLIIQKWCSYTESPSIGADLLKYFNKLKLNNIHIFTRAFIIRDYQLLNQIRNLYKLLLALENEITKSEMRDYVHALEEANRLGNFLYYVTMYTAVGIK